MIQNKASVMVEDNCKNKKISKERINILFGCSSTGEKLKPLVKGKGRKLAYHTIHFNFMKFLINVVHKAFMIRVVSTKNCNAS